MSERGHVSTAAFDHHRGAMPLLRQTSTWRGWFFFGANLLGYVVANAFLYYLSTGRWWDFTLTGYRQALAVPLTEILVRPPSIFTHPWMIAVTGLILGVIAFGPTMLAVLYRLWVSLLFVAAVAVFGHAPFLAACLALGCVVASQTRLRSDLPFLALLVGMASSVAVYLIVFVLFLGPTPDRVPMPFQKPVFYLPFVVALVSVVLGGGGALALARATRYRPGVIWPVLLVLVAMPGWLFWEKVGPDELDYALIAAQVGSREVIFTPQDLLARDDTEEPADPQALLDRRREDLAAQCRTFLTRHESSDWGAAITWILATLDDVKLHSPRLAAGRTRLVYTGPVGASVGGWPALVARYPQEPQALVGRFRLGVAALRKDDITLGRRYLMNVQGLMRSFLQRRAARAEKGPWRRVFTPMESLPGDDYYRSVLTDVEHVVWLMEANEVPDGSKEVVHAFADYMTLWPFIDVPAERLEKLATSHERTPLADNFRLQAALVKADDFSRARALATLADGLGDAAIAANYELGRLGWRIGDSPTWKSSKLKAPKEYFRLVVSAPDNPYRLPAEQHLKWLAAREGHTR